MQRRTLIASATATAFVSPQLLLGCAAPGGPVSDAGRDPAPSQLTVLYDAFGRDPAMKKDWGYAAFIETGGRRILFDTGNNGDTLRANAKARGIDLSRLDFVVMSHRHGDHMGGVASLLDVNPKVRIYAPKEGFGVYGSDLPSSFYRKDETLPPEQRYYDGKPADVLRFGAAWPHADIQLIDKSTQIAPGIHLVSLVSDKPGTLELRELSLALATPDGMVLLVGCSHPGIENIVKAVAAIDPRIQLIAGGFHLVVSKDAEIEQVVVALRDTYHVARVAPGHCTGEPTFSALKKAFGERYLYAGLGSTLPFAGARATVGARPPGIASAAPDEQELRSYRALLALAGERRRALFADLRAPAGQDGAYLGQCRRSMLGCC